MLKSVIIMLAICVATVLSDKKRDPMEGPSFFGSSLFGTFKAQSG